MALVTVLSYCTFTVPTQSLADCQTTRNPCLNSHCPTEGESLSATRWANNYSLIVLLFVYELREWQVHYWYTSVKGLQWWTRKEIPCKSVRKTDFSQNYGFFWFFFKNEEMIVFTCFVKSWRIEKSLCKYTAKNCFCKNPFHECASENKCICMKKCIAFIGLQHSLNLNCGSEKNILKFVCFIHK